MTSQQTVANHHHVKTVAPVGKTTITSHAHVCLAIQAQCVMSTLMNAALAPVTKATVRTGSMAMCAIVSVDIQENLVVT